MMRELGSEYLFPCTTQKSVEQVVRPIGASLAPVAAWGKHLLHM